MMNLENDVRVYTKLAKNDMPVKILKDQFLYSKEDFLNSLKNISIKKWEIEYFDNKIDKNNRYYFKW